MRTDRSPLLRCVRPVHRACFFPPFASGARPLTFLSAICITMLLLTAGAQAATYTVSNTKDSGAGSLRAAITSVNGDTSADTIAFQSGLTGTITLQTALPEITNGVTITGPGVASITISGATTLPIFSIASGVTVTISGLTLSGGAAGSGDGGAINSSGTLVVVSCAIVDNSAASGGGIYVADGTLTVLDSTFSANSATGGASGGGNGGAIAVADGTATVTNSTLAGNTASGGMGGAIYNNATLSITNSTISANSAGSGSGGGVYNGATLTLANTILSGNTATTSADLDGTDTNSGGNQIGVSASSIDLAALGSYGGTLQTMLPLPGSSSTVLGSTAICAGSKSLAKDASGNALTTDERGFPLGAASYCPAGSIDSGAVQTNYTSIQFTNAATYGYAGLAGQAVATPAAPNVSVTENGQNIGGVPVTLTEGSGTATGVGPVTTVAGKGATFSDITVATADASDTLSVSLQPTSTATAMTSSVGLVIEQPIALVSSLPGATVGTSYTQQLVTSGGTSPFTDTVTSGSLPPGLTFGSDGSLSGTPTTANSNDSFGLTITDNYGFTAKGSYSMAVAKGTAQLSFTGLTQTYTGKSLPVTVTTTPSGLTVDLTYTGISPTVYAASSTAPTNVGTYTVKATVNDPNWTGSASPTLTISSGSVTITLNNLSQTYGSTTPVTATTSPASITVDLTFTGINGTVYGPSATQPTNAGTYSVSATVDAATEPNYSGSSSGTLTIAQEPVTITLGNLSQTFGSTTPVTVTSSPSVTLDVTYTGVNGTVYGPSSTQPTNAGTYSVSAVVDPTTEPNYSGSRSGVLTIAQEPVTITLGNLSQTFGATTPVTVTASPNVTIDVTYTGANGTVYGPSSTQPTNAGTYSVNAVVDPTTEPNYSGSKSGVLTIAQEPVTITLGNLSQTFGATTPVTVTTSQSGLTIDLSFSGNGYGPSSTQPTNAGTYTVNAKVDPTADPNFSGSVTEQLQIAKATATVSLTNLVQVYTGTTVAVTVTTTPVVQAVVVTYNGSTNLPVNPGTYSVIATVNDPNYQGSATAQLVIENFTLSASFTGSITVTQGFASASGVSGVLADPFTPQTITMTPSAVGYTPNLNLSCMVSAVTAPSSPTSPACLLNDSSSSIKGDGVTPVTLTINATNATPGIYAVTFQALDPATQLTRVSTFTLNVRSASSPLTLVSGATTGNTATVSYVLPANVGLSGLSCTSVAGPILAAPVDPGALSIACSLSPASVGSSTSIQVATVSVTVNTGTTTTAQLVDHSNYIAAGVLGIPLLGFLGLLGGGRKSGAAIFRLFALLAIVVAGMQLTGCGGSFTRPTTVSGSTPPGSYDVLVQGTGSDNQPYQAVVQLNVTR